MSIKQNGGVFGRNPTFNDVTIEGQLTFDGDIDINSDLKVNGDLDVVGGMTVDTDALVVDKTNNRVGVNIATPLVSLESRTAGNGAPSSSGTAQPNGAIRVSSPATSGILDFGVNGGAPWIQATDRTDLSQLYTVSLNPNGGNVSIGNGNVVIGTSGKGIDFSATSGTGTSELLDDYEEGTWTPIYKTSGTNYDSIVYNFQFGTYIKIGQLVWVSFQLRTTSVTVGSASGNIRLGGLPFTVGTGNADDAFSANAIHTNFASGAHGVSSPVNGTTESQLMDSSHSIASAVTIATGANGNWLQGNIIYVAS